VAYNCPYTGTDTTTLKTVVVGTATTGAILGAAGVRNPQLLVGASIATGLVHGLRRKFAPSYNKPRWR